MRRSELRCRLDPPARMARTIRPALRTPTAPVMDAGGARLLAVCERLQQVGQLGVAVLLDKPRHTVAPVPTARLADNRERERAISRHPRTIAREPEQRAEFGVVNVTSDTQNREQKNMLQGYIVDPDTGKVVA